MDGVDDDHEDEPEPHGEVHLLVDDVLDEGGQQNNYQDPINVSHSLPE